MSFLRVDSITNRNSDGPPLFLEGITVSSGYALTCSGGVNITGVVTATSFSGMLLVLLILVEYRQERQWQFNLY